MAKAKTTKRTKEFLKKGGLSSQIEARNKRRSFALKKKGRDVKRFVFISVLSPLFLRVY